MKLDDVLIAMRNSAVLYLTFADKPTWQPWRCSREKEPTS
jgi:hypothetical protein